MTKAEQYKDHYFASYGTIVKFLTYKNLTAGNLSINYQDEVMKNPNMPKNISDVYLMSATR